jgi:hypothetical protein
LPDPTPRHRAIAVGRLGWRIEEAFRFNNRKTDDQARFDAVMSTVPGRRVTYRQLCEIDGCGFMGLQ